MGHEYFKEESGKDALYKISKAYSVYDEEVGYCQGFSFMAAVLLIQVRGRENVSQHGWLATFSRKCLRSRRLLS